MRSSHFALKVLCNSLAKFVNYTRLKVCLNYFKRKANFRLQEKCVSNPLIVAFKMFINGDLNLRNGTIDHALLRLITNVFSSDLLTGVSNLLGGITYDEKHRVSGKTSSVLDVILEMEFVVLLKYVRST